MKILPGGFGEIWDYIEQLDIPEDALCIDLGGGMSGWPRADWIVDMRPFHKRSIKGDTERVTKSSYVQTDLNEDWLDRCPRSFDIVWCNHTLEDLRDPIGLLHKIKKIGKRAIIGVPHWTYEASIVNKTPRRELQSGFPHHRWLVGINRKANALEFMQKGSWLGLDHDYKKTQPNLNIDCLTDELVYAEITYEYPGDPLRKDTLEWLAERWK